MDTDLAFAPISEQANLLKSGDISSSELTRLYLERIDHHDRVLGAYLTLTADDAMLQAKRADERLVRGEAAELTGIPVALKDILSTCGVRTTCGSRILEHYVPRYSATAVERLNRAGAVMLGKTNMDEFAMGSSNENSAFGPVKNPWDFERVPGGSSGGSAAAVAAGLAGFALGTDTGGSIRQPASLTGTVGLKPTYGRVSRYGLVAFGSSLDQIGPITRSVRDAAMALQVIAGPDPRDSTSLDQPVPDYVGALSGDLRGLRLGIPDQYFGEGMSEGVETVLRTSVDVLRDLGAVVEEMSLPHTHYGISTYYVVSPAEAMANLARFDGVRYGLSVVGDDIWTMFAETREAGFGREVKRRILLGAYVLSAGYYDAYYLKAQRVRTLVKRDFEEAFERYDALLAPTSPTVAFRLGERTDDPLQMYLSDVYTVPASIAGIPGLSVPAGFSEGLPVGLQVLGPALGEAVILRVGDAFERATSYARRHPPLLLKELA